MFFFELDLFRNVVKVVTMPLIIYDISNLVKSYWLATYVMKDIQFGRPHAISFEANGGIRG
jgi:hypothetical protein